VRVAVITPTIGSACLSDAVESVSRQTHDCTHYVVVDGRVYVDAVEQVLDNTDRSRVRTIVLPENIGKGWYGHRVYAASPFLLNEDVVMFLDEDNWLAADHVASLLKLMRAFDLSWAYSLRKIFDKDKTFVCNDECESLGQWPAYVSNDVFHVDTSSFALRREAAIATSVSWYGKWGADRQVFAALKSRYPRFGCTGLHTLCYRLDGNPGSVTADFFLRGNEIMMRRYGGRFPWASETVANP
jgi:glycosyltransferase involved in cell wall biosynthesis